MSIEVKSTGVKIQARQHFRAPAIPHEPGKHLWIAIGMWRITPTADEWQLDTENLLTVDGPGCYWCEEAYTPEVAARRCRGDSQGRTR